MLKWIKNKIGKLFWKFLLSEVGSTSFPANLDSYVTRNAGDVISESHMNNVQDSIEAIEAKLGVDSSAVASSIDYFLKHASGAYRLHKHDGSSDDGAKLDWDDIWNDAVHDHSAAGEGGTLDWDSVWADAVHDHSSAGEGGTSLTTITALTAANDLDIGAHELKAETFESDVTTGTPPFVVASTSKVINLNADTVDGVSLPGTLAAVLSDHDKAAHDALNIDADTLDAAHASATPSNGIIVIADASGFLHTPSAAPDADYEVSNKKYVDDNVVGTGDVSQTILKTSIGEVSNAGQANLTLPGGEYGFYPQIKSSAGTSIWHANILGESGWSFAAITAYTTNISVNPNGGGTVYAQQRYVTASGEDHWIFLLIDKVSHKIIGSYQAPDHPCYGQGGDEIEIPHPFGNYDPSKHEIIIVDNSILIDLKPKITRKKSMLTLINEDCLIDDSKRPKYEPREIIEINEFPDDPQGEIIKTIKTPVWSKIKISSEYINLEKRMVSELPSNILFKKLRLK